MNFYNSMGQQEVCREWLRFPDKPIFSDLNRNRLRTMGQHVATKETGWRPQLAGGSLPGLLVYFQRHFVIEELQLGFLVDSDLSQHEILNRFFDQV